MSQIKNIILFMLLTSLVFCQKTYIHAGKLIDGVTDIPIEMVTIIIKCIICIEQKHSTTNVISVVGFFYSTCMYFHQCLH